MIHAMPGAISLNTSIEDLHSFKIARLGPILSQKLAKALATQTHKKNSAEATVEDLLNYFPMRYEDRSRPALIKDLDDGVEASLDLTVTKTNGYVVRNPRGYGRAQRPVPAPRLNGHARTGRTCSIASVTTTF